MVGLLIEATMDFAKICRICLNEGNMMSIFKVNISKKMMACASVQVWQNDGLPPQICNKCSAKLHISFQFKKLCEKSDSKLRQYLVNLPTELIEAEITQKMQPAQQISKLETLDVSQLAQTQPQNCVYIECSPLVDLNPDQKFESFVSQPPLTQINYNIPHQIASYNMQNGQVYNSTYTMQGMQPVMHQVMQLQAAPSMQQMQAPIVQQPIETINTELDEDNKPTKKVLKAKINIKLPETGIGKQCTICSKIFATTTKLTRHMKTHSTDMPYKCKVCTKAFSHSGNYKIHLRMHTDERPFRCKVCDKGCRQAQDLEKHMRTHTGERPHKCSVCPRAFSTSSNLIAHIRTHTGERPYVCCVCQKAFCQSNELTKHMRTHTGEKSHVCDICHKGFNGSSTLIVHRRSHTGERPYVCTMCSKGFTQSSCLAVHMKRHFNDDKKMHLIAM